MSDTRPDQRYSNFIIFLILLFPIVINSVKILSSVILLILSILGLYIAISEQKNPFKVKELKLFSWLVTSYFGVMLLSVLVADGVNAEFHHLGRKLQFLLAPFIALAIFRVNIPLRDLLLSIKIGLIIIGIITIVQALLGYDRPSGMINQNIFGDIAVAMLFLSMVRIFEEDPKEWIITIASSMFGLSAIVLSGNRGSWISAIILAVVYLAIIYKKYLHNNVKYKLLALSLVALILALASNTQTVSTQVSNTKVAIDRWSSGDVQRSSIGERLNMWMAGLEAVKQSPIIGYGYRNANKAAQEYTSKDIAGYTHLHNEYITNLVSAGMIGLISLLFLLFAPVKIFYQRLKHKETYHYAAMGVLLSIGYATFGFSHIAFGEEHINSFYVLIMGFLLPRVLNTDNR